MHNKQEKSAVLRQIAPYMSLGGELAATMLGAAAAGWLLDTWLSTSPWLLASCALVGGGVALTQFIRRVQKPLSPLTKSEDS